MIRLALLFVAVSMLTPIAMKTILPEGQQNAMKHWLLSNDMSFIAGVLLGDNSSDKAEESSDLLSVLDGSSWEGLKDSARNATGSLSAEVDSGSAHQYFDELTNSGQNLMREAGKQAPADDWFPEFQFSEKTQVHSVQDSGCVQGKQISINSGNCEF